MVNVKLVGANRFICPKGGITNVITRNEIVSVTAAQGAYLSSQTTKDKSNNIHPLLVITEEAATATADAQMTEQQRLAKAVMAEANGEIVAEEVKVEEAPAPKRRAKKATGTRGTRNASKVVA